MSPEFPPREIDRTPSGEAASAIILVVERDPHVRELEEFFLREAGFDVRFAESGDDALELIQHLRPPVVVTEILVPGLDGLTLTRLVREDQSLDRVKVVALSFLAAADRAAEAGADAFLLKPLSDDQLLSTVRGLLPSDASPELVGGGDADSQTVQAI